MTRQDWYILGGVLVGLAVINSSSRMTRIIRVLSDFIPSVEGFSPTPYWDVSRYSWGYGTAAPGAAGTITREQAAADMIAHALTDYAKLKARITRSLSVQQWAALLSFSYNLGVGNAYKLVTNINTGNDQALNEQWGSYVYSGGAVNNALVGRRKKEWDLWVS